MVAFQRFKRELSGNMPHLVSGFKIQRDREQRTPRFHDEISEAQRTSVTRARRGQRVSQLYAAFGARMATSSRAC